MYNDKTGEHDKGQENRIPFTVESFFSIKNG